MKTRATAATLLVTVALLAAACGGGTPGPGSSSNALDTSCASASSCFTVGNVSVISGPVQGLFEGAQVGTDAYLSYINSQGGVDGRKFKLIDEDDALTGATNQHETESLIAQGVDAFVGNFSLEDSYGALALAKSPSIPDVSVSLDPKTNDLPNNFSIQPLGQGWNTGPLLYYAKEYPQAIKHVGAFVGATPPSPAAFDGEEKAMDALSSQGYDIVDVQLFSPFATETDFVSDLAKMQQEGVEAVDLTELDVQEADQIIQAMAQANFHPQLIFSGGPLYNSAFIPNAGGAANVNGIQIAQEQAMYLPPNSSQPTVGTSLADTTFLTWVNKVHPNWSVDLYTLYGWASAELYVQGVEAASTKSGPKPTPAQVTAALAKITSFDAGGLLAPANPADKQPPTQWLLVTIENGKYVRASFDPPTGFSHFTYGYYPKVTYTPPATR
jgi:ABC-type branched-subunit amino acid transport system substrate-binding protein